MPDPEQDLAASISTNVAALTFGTNVFYGPERPSKEDTGITTDPPAEAAFCWESGGPPAEPFNGESTRLVRAQVRVLVRGDKDDYDGGKTLADSVHAATEHASVSGYINVRNLEALPNRLRMDDSGRHRWQWTVEMIFEG